MSRFDLIYTKDDNLKDDKLERYFYDIVDDCVDVDECILHDDKCIHIRDIKLDFINQTVGWANGITSDIKYLTL